MKTGHEYKVEQLPPICKKLYKEFVKDIDKYDFDEFGVYTAKTILYNSITNQSNMSFMVTANQGLAVYVNGEASEDQKECMRRLIGDWILKHSKL